MRVEFLGAHNCESKSTRLVSLLIDDVLAFDAGGLTSALSFDAQLRIKALLLTHHHYDHIRDVPSIAMNVMLNEKAISVYSPQSVYDILTERLLDGRIYFDFLKKPEGKPAIKFTIVQPGRLEKLDGYSILPVSVNHATSAVGYQVTSPDGKSIFYTGDTGPGLEECWRQISPQLLIIEVTAPNRYEEFAHQAGHLNPELLRKELESFRRLKGYLPRVVTVHMNPMQEKEIAKELGAVGKSLGASIVLAREGMVLNI